MLGTMMLGNNPVGSFYYETPQATVAAGITAKPINPDFVRSVLRVHIFTIGNLDLRPFVSLVNDTIDEITVGLGLGAWADLTTTQKAKLRFVLAYEIGIMVLGVPEKGDKRLDALRSLRRDAVNRLIPLSTEGFSEDDPGTTGEEIWN